MPILPSFSFNDEKKNKQTQGHGISTLDFNITLVICFHSIYQKYNISESIKFKK